MKYFVKSVLYFIAVLGAVCHSACQRGPSEADAPPSVILITLDALRADHLGCYDYPRPTSPYIDAFAQKSTLYTRAYSSSSWTVPTHASLFTGKFAFEHGAHGFRVDEPGTNVNPLSQDQLTLAEVFWKEHYSTGAFVANEAFLSPRWQLNQGFEVYKVSGVYGDELNRDIFRWLDAVARSKRPFFLFINYMDTHRPYNATRPAVFLKKAAVHDNGQLLDQLYEAVMPGGQPFPARLAGAVIDQYDTAVANVDRSFEALVKRLEQLDLYENTVIVLTSDHGEFFGEHDLVEHSKDVYEEVLRVPLIVKTRGQSDGGVVEALTVSTDIPGLILSQFPGEKWGGYRDLFADVPGNHPVIAENYFARNKDLFHPVWGSRFDRIRTAFIEWPFKYIESTDGVNELYDLENDRAESKNLFQFRPELTGRMKTALEDFYASRERSTELIDQEPLTEEETRRLKSLGYIE